MVDITSILREKDVVRFKKITLEASGIYLRDGKEEHNGVVQPFTRSKSGKVILDDPAPLTEQEIKLNEAEEAEQRQKEKDRDAAKIAGSKKSAFRKRGPLDKKGPFKK